jgi:glycerol-3-phosphate acyltransferase PlsY
MGINLPTVLILFEDLLKGGVAGWIAVFLSKTSAPMIYEISVIPAFFLGHLFPVFSQIKGEKGFATFLGISFALNLSFGIYLIALWLIAVLTSKEWGLSAISVLFIAPFIAYFMFEDFGIAIEIYLLSSLSVYVYRGTIYRLCKDIKKKIS